MTTSFGQIVQFVDGFGWGIAPDGQTICLGREEKVKEAINNPKLKCGDPVIDGIISLERRLIEKAEAAKIKEAEKGKKK